jgi:thiol-disulfide isomerase/thioredoxin
LVIFKKKIYVFKHDLKFLKTYNKMPEHLTGVGYLEDMDVDDQGKLLNPEISGKTPTILFIYASWCPHCTSVIPVIQDFVNSNKGKVNVLAIQADDERPSVKSLSARLKSTYPQFKGFPTFVKYDGKKPSKKQLKDRSMQGLEEFTFN